MSVLACSKANNQPTGFAVTAERAGRSSLPRILTRVAGVVLPVGRGGDGAHPRAEPAVHHVPRDGVYSGSGAADEQAPSVEQSGVLSGNSRKK